MLRRHKLGTGGFPAAERIGGTFPLCWGAAAAHLPACITSITTAVEARIAAGRHRACCTCAGCQYGEGPVRAVHAGGRRTTSCKPAPYGNPRVVVELPSNSVTDIRARRSYGWGAASTGRTWLFRGLVLLHLDVPAWHPCIS